MNFHRNYPRLIFSTALILGFACLLSLYPRFRFETFSWSGADALEYNFLADNLAQGHGFSLRISAPYVPSAARMPGYPAIIALSKIIFHGIIPVIIVQMAAYGAGAVLAYKIARMFLSERMSAVAGFLVVFHPYILFMAMSLMTETFFIASIMASVYFLLRYFQEHAIKQAIFSTLLLGFAALLRPTPLYMITIWVAMVAWDGWNRNERWKKIGLRACLVVLIFVAILVPWMVRNKIEFGRWGFVSANSFGFYAATSVYLTALHEHIPHQEARVRLQNKFETTFKDELAADTNYPDFAYKGYDEFEYGDWFAARSSAIIKDNLGLFAREIMTSIPDFLTKDLWLHPFEKYDILHPANQPLTPLRRVWSEQGMGGLTREVLARFSCGSSCVFSFGIAALGRIFYLLLSVFGFVGLYFMIRSREHLARSAGLLFSLIILYFAAAHLILTSMAGHERYRLPIVPLMIVSALSGLSGLGRRTRGFIPEGKSDILYP
ncbi:MAG: glycosyltransferase family 39 protein [Candidatus Sungbacteria bacterium]|uniref:Glycosyltransferase family 39 protein n=1 Tax=Candidatus Sungiibacteriota bacterium TaxID=2750080 RepID=A0A932R1U5_9BACT|nr:glycosyltransferase family 39 protein [Candidatus Sungbacteria bacterium]